MSKLATLKKQIAALEAQAERIAKEEMSSAIAKVKAIMTEYNLSIEHLTQAVGSKRSAKKSSARAKAKMKATSIAKYVDPKTGKTWSGFGRAPGWIAGAKNRDAFLVGASPAASTEPKAAAATKKSAARTAKIVKVAKNAVSQAAKKSVSAKGSKAQSAPAAAK